MDTEQLRKEFEEIVMEAIRDNVRTRKLDCGHEQDILPETRYRDVAEHLAIVFLSKLSQAQAEAREEVIQESQKEWGRQVESAHVPAGIVRDSMLAGWRQSIAYLRSKFPPQTN